MLHFLRPRSVGPVYVCAVEHANLLSRRIKVGLLVSISDPERRRATREHLGAIRARLCPLDFHDIEREAPGMVAPAEKHITSALTNAARIARHRPILVHCQAGVSRSSAMALILATARHLGAGESAKKAVDIGVSQVCAATPHARPNMRMIELGAEALGLKDTNFADLAWDLHRSGL